MSATTNISEPAAILFDLDGTLLDTADDLGAALNHVLAEVGLPLMSADQYRPVTSDGALGLLQLGFGSQLNDFNYHKLREKLLTYYQQHIAHHTKLYAQIAKLLTIIENAHIPWGIITNKPEQLTQRLLPAFPEFNRCAIMLGGDSLAKRKPDPLPLLVACETLAVPANRCFYIGDAERDILAGNNANMTTFIAGWGYIKNSDNLANWKADHHLLTPLNLLPYIFPTN